MEAIPLERPRTRAETEQAAETLLKDSGAEGSYPVDLEGIAQYLGFRTIGFTPDSKELAEVSGMVDYAQKTLYVNANDVIQRQRFTLAHEIGHAYLHKDTEAQIDLRTTIDGPTEPKEIEANNFAAALLMPKKAFVTQWFHFRGNVEILSKFFGVSTQAIEVRTKTSSVTRV